MSRISCKHCHETFDAARHPLCPDCLAARWLRAEDFIRPKHDPRALPLTWDAYRSVLSPAFVEDPRPHLEHAAQNGTWYHDTHYDMYVHFTAEPLGLSPGAGIPKGKKSPEHALDSLLIAEANSPEAHAFAVDRRTLEAQLRAGEFIALASCAEKKCENLQLPGSERCVAHASASPEGAAP